MSKTVRLHRFIISKLLLKLCCCLWPWKSSWRAWSWPWLEQKVNKVT